MKHFVHRHRRKFVGHGVLLFAILATSMLSFNGGTTTLFFMPHGGSTLKVGETTHIDVNISTKTPINALGATIRFPREHLEIIAISKERSFLDLWTEETTIREETGTIHFSGGTFRAGGLTGTGTTITFTVRALKPGTAKLEFAHAEVYSSDGTGLIADKKLEPVSLQVSPREGVTAAPAKNPSLPSQLVAPSADLNGDGKVTLVDASILTYHLFRTYAPRYDLDVDGKIGLSDISVLFSKLTR